MDKADVSSSKGINKEKISTRYFNDCRPEGRMKIPFYKNARGNFF